MSLPGRHSLYSSQNSPSLHPNLSAEWAGHGIVTAGINNNSKQYFWETFREVKALKGLPVLWMPRTMSRALFSAYLIYFAWQLRSWYLPGERKVFLTDFCLFHARKICSLPMYELQRERKSCKITYDTLLKRFWYEFVLFKSTYLSNNWRQSSVPKCFVRILFNFWNTQRSPTSMT